MNNDANDGATKAPTDEAQGECQGKRRHAWKWDKGMFAPGAELDPSTNKRMCTNCGEVQNVTLGGKLAQ